jgi:hypothetical protein
VVQDRIAARLLHRSLPSKEFRAFDFARITGSIDWRARQVTL